MAEGIRKRHSTDCSARSGGRCRCDGGYEASVYSPRDSKKIYKTFPRESEAKSWRADAKRSLDQGKLRAPNGRTLREAAEAWIDGVERGEIRNRSGHPFKPSTLRGYRLALTERILPEIGSLKLSTITTADLQALVDRWQTEGHAPSTVRNSVKPLQAIYRRARAREGLSINPTHDLELPTPNPTEVEIVAPKVAARLLTALPTNDRAVWATALYAGLRYGELRALRWGAVDMSRGVIKVRESWDPKEGPIPPKTRKSRRTVPMPEILREQLVPQRGTQGKGALVFGTGTAEPFQAERLYRDAAHYWRRAGLRERLRLHQARHTYASFMIAAGVNAKALAAFMGHSSITVTFDLYGHLMPGSEAEGAALLDAFLGTRTESVRDTGLRWGWIEFVATQGGKLSGIGEVVQSSCSACDVLVHWKVTDIDSSTTECEPLDAPTGFVCDHWRDHQEALGRAPLNPSRRAYAGTVSARVLSRAGCAPPLTAAHHGFACK